MSLKEGSPTFSCSPMVLLLTLWILFVDITTAGPHYTTYSCTYRTLTHGISVSDIPSADTNRCSLTSLSQRLSISDRVVTPSFYKLPLSQRLSVLDRVATQPYKKFSFQMLTAYHITYPGDTTLKVPEDCCLE